MVDGQPASPWLVPIGIVLVLLGLWLLVVALRPRPRPATQLQAQTGVYLRTRDIARLARGAAESVGGVISADASASRGAVDVSVRTTGAQAIPAAVESPAARRLSALDRAPKVTVTTAGDDPPAPVSPALTPTSQPSQPSSPDRGLL